MKSTKVCHFLVLLTVVLSDASASSESLYSLKAVDIEGVEIPMEKYRGKILMIVNVASECGYTDEHYQQMVRLGEILQFTRRFQVLAFPCNQFGGQEPKSNEEIFEFAQMNYQINFPMFSKVDVIGPTTHPIWRFLVETSGRTPEWNFYKYLIDHKGHVAGVWGPDTPPHMLGEEIRKLTEAAMRNEEIERLRARGIKVEL